jgi:hypothetical protein
VEALGTLPVLYHLLWKRLLMMDLSLVLSDRTMVRAAPQVANVANDLVMAG